MEVEVCGERTKLGGKEAAGEDKSDGNGAPKSCLFFSPWSSITEIKNSLFWLSVAFYSK